MSTLSLVSFPQNVALCSSDDVTALLTQVASSFSIDDVLMSNAIEAAQERLQSLCNRPLVPTRIQQPVDGNGHTRMVLPYGPILAINTIDIYYNFPLSLTRRAREYDLIVDRKNGIVAFPPFTYTAAFIPQAFVFWEGSRNVQLDYVVGWSKSMQGEKLANSGDNKTYSFANPTAIRQATGTVPTMNQSPAFSPIVYVNGVVQNNTTWQQSGESSEVWSIAADNLVYTLNTAQNGGIASITFNTPLSANDVVTADYTYSATPADLKDACAKLAAIDILTSTAAAPYGDITTGGQMIVQMNGFKTQSAPSGQFGPQIATWQSHVDAVVKRYKAAYLPIGTSYRDDVTLRY